MRKGLRARSIQIAAFTLLSAAMVATVPSAPTLYADARTADARTADARNVRDVTLPAGTVLPLTLDSYVASDTSHVEDSVRAHVRRAVVVNGRTIVPAGSTVVGYVTSVQRPGRVKGRGSIAFRFQSMTTPDGGRVNIQTSRVARMAPATKGEDAMKIALPAAGGAVVGALVGGKKGAAIGAGAGGGAGAGVVLATRGREVRLGPGAVVNVRLTAPVRVEAR